MFDKNGHLTDEALIRLIDGEMMADAMHKARAHCTECCFCQSRQAQIEQASSEFADLYSATKNSPLFESSSACSAKLKDRLTAANQRSQRFGPRQFACFSQDRAHLFVAAAVLIFAIIVLFRPGTSFRGQLISSQPGIRLLPDNTLTPGATRPVSLAENCSRQQDDLDPAVSASIKKTVFQEYGIKSSSDKDYQVDYLINPQLGGTNDVRNLWPEPYRSTVWNARAKDALEDRLHRMVCNKQIDLASAQRELATNWIAAYKKHFHTEMPL